MIWGAAKSLVQGILKQNFKFLYSSNFISFMFSNLQFFHFKLEYHLKYS